MNDEAYYISLEVAKEKFPHSGKVQNEPKMYFSSKK